MKTTDQNNNKLKVVDALYGVDVATMLLIRLRDAKPTDFEHVHGTTFDKALGEISERSKELWMYLFTAPDEKPWLAEGVTSDDDWAFASAVEAENGILARNQETVFAAWSRLMIGLTVELQRLDRSWNDRTLILDVLNEAFREVWDMVCPISRAVDEDMAAECGEYAKRYGFDQDPKSIRSWLADVIINITKMLDVWVTLRFDIILGDGMLKGLTQAPAENYEDFFHVLNQIRLMVYEPLARKKLQQELARMAEAEQAED